jgi:uncharacterized protein
MQQTAALDSPATERIAIVDILRAVALFGIIISHASLSFLAGQEPTPGFNEFSPVDNVAMDLSMLLTYGKFFAIFAFLFGMSFAIQLDNAARKGASFVGRFAWRLIVLLGIALVHSMFFSGDVLVVYALLGLLLIPCRKLKSRTLLITGAILVLNLPGLLLGFAQLAAPGSSAEQQETAAKYEQQFTAQAQEHYRIKTSGTVGEIIEMNLSDSLLNKLIFLVFSGRLWITFGYFLLGLWAGRVALFRDTEINRRLFKQLMIWAGPIALVTSVIHVIGDMPLFAPATLETVLLTISFTTQQATLAAFIVAATTLYYWRDPTRGLLPKLAPVGKMGLTTYLMQTMFGITLFYGIGFGMLGKMGVTSSIAAGIAFFVFQIFFAHWWLRRFEMGPFEWLWRALTYFTLKPKARAQASVA